jgi:hypothetical protein
MKNGRLSTPTTPEATREMKTPFNCANHLCQNAAYVARPACVFLDVLGFISK